MSDSEDNEKKLPQGLYTEKPKKSKSQNLKTMKTEDMDLGAVPPHIMRIMQSVEDKKKKRKEQEKNKKNSADSISILKKMMGSMRTKCEMDTAGDEERMDKENDIAKIANARDIFKHLETNPEENTAKNKGPEKHKRVEAKVDFMLEGQNKAEEIRKARLKEMAMMKAAREQALEDEEMWNRNNKDKSDEIKKQREMEIEMMRAARQQAIEEEERLEQIMKMQQTRNVSPGLEAAKNVTANREFIDDGAAKIEQMRMERIREIEQMKRAREEMIDEDLSKDVKSEASRELEVFRSSQSSGSIKDRYRPSDSESRTEQENRRAPRQRNNKADNWMVNSSNDKLEEARMAREREIEMMMVARSRAIEEEEEERAMEEAERRLEAERKAHEMAALVADLQRMRATTARDAEEEAQLTRYQEEMLARVMELHEIARGGMIANN